MCCRKGGQRGGAAGGVDGGGDLIAAGASADHHAVTSTVLHFPAPRKQRVDSVPIFIIIKNKQL